MQMHYLVGAIDFMNVNWRGKDDSAVWNALLATLVKNTITAFTRAIDHIRSWFVSDSRMTWFDYDFDGGGIYGYPRKESGDVLNLSYRSSTMVILQTLAAAFIGGYRRDNFKWAELRCILNVEPPEEPDDIYNEYPDPIFFTSGF